MRDAVIGESDEDCIGGGALKFPDQMMPGERCRYGAGDPGVFPCIVGSATPYVPVRAVSDIALRPKDEFMRAIGLIGVKLQGLSGIWVGEIEINFIFEVLRGIDGAKLFPPESV